MVYKARHIISESEKNRIRSLYGAKSKKDYVFDFVLTENNKYVIILDQVFVEGGGGKSIGSIWDNTHIFTELIKESMSKVETITENIKEEFATILESIVWTKEDISKWVSEGEILGEDKDSLLGNLWNKVKQVGSQALSAISGVAMYAFKQGILPFMRWIRRNAVTNIGIVLDVVVAILSFKSSALIWAIIVLIDIYEITTGDYDPKEPERQQMPFFYLMSDLLAVVLTAGTALMFRKSIPLIVKSGEKAAGSAILSAVKTLGQKLPSVKNVLKRALESIKKVFPNAGNIVSTISRGIETVLVKFEQFLKKLFPAALGGVTALGLVKATQYGISQLDKPNEGGETKLGKFAQGVNKDLQIATQRITGNKNVGQLKVDDESKKAAEQAFDKIYSNT